MSKHKVIAILGVVLILTLTYFRENLLLEVNALLNGDQFDRSSAYWFFDFFKEMGQSNLIRWKWGLTASFSIAITVLTIGSLFLWFKSLELIKFISMLYLLLFGLMTVVALVGFLLNAFQSVYPLLRKALGLVQSPIPFFVFYLLSVQKNKNKRTNL
jgi:hypothetical protein